MKILSFPRNRESSRAQRLGPRLPFGMRSAIRGGDGEGDVMPAKAGIQGSELSAQLPRQPVA
jgi:hypothetical protein